MLRPASTRWFEVLCPRNESLRTLAGLARTGAVEVEVRSPLSEGFPVAELAAGLARYHDLASRYGRYWERGRRRSMPLSEGPFAVLARALERIDAWRREADPLIDALQSCEEELPRLEWLSRILEAIQDSPLDFDRVTDCGPLFGTFCAILPREADPRLPDWTIARTVLRENERCFLILGPAERLDAVKHRIKSVKGRVIERPGWLRGNAREALSRLVAHRAFLAKRLVHLQAELDTLLDDYGLGDLLGEVAWLDWFAAHVGRLEPASEHLVWITGWTEDLGGERLLEALHRAETRALLRFTPPPRGTRPPQVLDNPKWLRSFEVFARALGVPGGDEADPTPLLALVVPLLFGYMFGDVGQGLMLVALGLWLRGRFEPARLLVVGGASAVAFGLLFGSLFAREDLIPALWLHPLEAPLAVLLVPLAFAVLLLSLGQLLAGLSALWRGELRTWLLLDAGFLVLYLASIGLVAGLPLGGVALAGLAWYLAGSFVVHRRLLGALAALGHLLEGGLQILVNTLSFARVGAFALAHAALSSALVSVAEAAGSPLGGLLIMVVGNLLIVALEGLVVSVQTTRLVLLEFFNRFLRGTGRVFRPLPAPPPLVTGEVI